jgi:hypothetical protein
MSVRSDTFSSRNDESVAQLYILMQSHRRLTLYDMAEEVEIFMVHVTF